jgi:hypothetical protein
MLRRNVLDPPGDVTEVLMSAMGETGDGGEPASEVFFALAGEPNTEESVFVLVSRSVGFTKGEEGCEMPPDSLRALIKIPPLGALSGWANEGFGGKRRDGVVGDTPSEVMSGDSVWVLDLCTAVVGG